MEEIKDMVAQALEQRHVLSKLKAELRAQVFLAIDEHECSSGGPGLASKTDNSKRTSLLSSTTGKLLAGLVHEFLEWTGMEFTLKVFEPEMGAPPEDMKRQLLAEQLEAPDAAFSDEPLLMQLLSTWQQSPGTGSIASSQSKGTAQAAGSIASGLVAAKPAAAARPATVPVPEPVGEAPRKPALQPLQQLKGSGAATVPTGAQPQQPVSATPSVQTPASVSAAAPAKAASVVQAPEQAADDSDADNVDVDIDDDLADAEIVDDDEDYAAVFASARKRRSSSSGGGTGPGPAGVNPGARTARSTSGSSRSSTSHDASETAAPASTAAPAAIPGPGLQRATEGDTGKEALDEAGSLSGLSGLSLSGRMRASKLRSLTAGASSLQEDASGGLGEQSEDLFSGDRSFGYSHELAGLAPGPRELLAASNSGNNLSYSGELMGPADTESIKAAAGPPKPAAKPDPLSGVRPPLPGKLAPLAPLGKPGGLAAASSASASLSTSGLSPLAPPAAGSRKDPGDIKAELRRAGLLNSDSYSVDLAKSNSGGSSHVGLDLPDHSQPDVAATSSRQGSSNGSGIEAAPQAQASSESSSSHVGTAKRSSIGSGHDGRSRGGTASRSQSGSGSHRSSISGSGSDELELPDSSQNKAAAASAQQPKPAVTVRPLHGGVYDAEVSVSQSMDIATEIVEEESHGSITSGSLSVGEAAQQLQPAGREYQASKGVSMDMRDTGLSTSDKSADDVDKVFANADLAETAEWAN